MQLVQDLSSRPLKLLDNRVWRTYAGGQMIEQWQGVPEAEAMDSDFPEIWVASTVKAKNAGREHIVEGLSQVELPANGGTMTLKQLIEADPAAFLGQRHVDKYGTETAVLVKILDAGERLTIQVHPDRQFAKQSFNSQFGKTEAWYVLGGRTLNGEEPYVLFGFKPGVTREQWTSLFMQQDIQGMIDALHKIPVEEGDVYLVEGGVPHAIGSGCFLIEIQEPTDLTLRVERTTPRGNALPDQACHQGIGFERMLDCFHYEALSRQETMKRWKKEPRLLHETERGSESVLLDRADTDRFRMHKIQVRKQYKCDESETFCIAIVVSGSGQLVWSGQGQQIAVGTSDQLFIPASVGRIEWMNTGEQPLNVVLCYPPE